MNIYNQDNYQSYSNTAISPKNDYGATSSYLNPGSNTYTFPKQATSNSYVPTPVNPSPYYKPQTKIPTYNPIPSYQVKKNPSYEGLFVVEKSLKKFEPSDAQKEFDKMSPTSKFLVSMAMLGSMARGMVLEDGGNPYEN